MQPKNDLDRLAKKYGSDKFGAHFYTKHYDRYLGSLRDSPIHLLEIGIGGWQDPQAGGASLRMWRDYFPKGQIYGLDYFDKSGIVEERVKTYTGSQIDPVAISRMLADAPPTGYDIIVEDGSHRSEHIITSFLMLFQYVAAGGWYIIEDTQTSYWPDYAGASADLNAPLTTMAFFKQFIDGLNWREIHRPGYSPTAFDLTIVSMHFAHNLIFIEKGANDEPSTFATDNRVPSAM